MYFPSTDAPPVLLYSFIEQTLQPGPAVSLKCSAAGNPTPQISWTLDGFPLPSNGRSVQLKSVLASFGRRRHLFTPLFRRQLEKISKESAEGVERRLKEATKHEIVVRAFVPPRN